MSPHTQVPWQELASRLNTLLAGLHPLLGRDLAVQYVHKAPNMRILLSDPMATLAKLRYKHEVYIEVVGAPPHPNLLAASQSSFLRTRVTTFRSKLVHMVDRSVRRLRG